MSNPALLVASLDGSLAYTDRAGSGAMTGVDPIRYSSGLWLEQATTNLYPNPRVTSAITGYSSASSAVITRDTSVTFDPSDTASAKIECPGSVAGEGLNATFSLAKAGGNPYSCGIKVIGPAGKVLRHWLRLYYSDTSPQDTSILTLALDGSWQDIIRENHVSHGANTLSAVSVMVRNNVAEAFAFHASWVQVEEAAFLTSRAIGDLGAGYGFEAAADASPSTRAASSASVATANHLDPSSGAIAFRVTPTIETGLEEIWGECGVKGAGTDHLRWGRDASTHPFVEWSSNDAAYQRLTASETLAAGTAYDLYFGHTGTVTSLAVDAGTLQTGTRAAVSGDFSTGDLTLEASAGGVIYQPFATFNRTLTAKEIATLNGKNNWTMNVLAGNPYRNFQLRPY